MPIGKSVFAPNNPVVVGVALLLIFLGVLFFQANSGSQVGNPVQAKPDKTGFTLAPELRGISGYINTDQNLSISSLKGTVVLVDFWTYTCINCIRTLPFLKSWHEKYADDGLVIIGVHTPEFEFEKDLGNVKDAVQKYGIKYPVVLDNDYATWRAYANHYWPHKYLIDAEGYIRYDHIGEGGYDETEAKIVELLKERDAKIEMDKTKPVVSPTDFSKIGTPEIYLGYNFARAPLGNEEGFQPQKSVEYKLPQEVAPNLAYLDGNWFNASDSINLDSGKGKVVLVFKAAKLNIVAGSAEGSRIRVLLNGSPLTETDAGSDAQKAGNEFVVNAREKRLYNIVSSPTYDRKLIIMEIEGKGFELYTFTFG